ncbi:hypothetical protein ACEPPN_000366 [Leptodophora sp. 'Broadleaf-Isolate-01']
MASSKNKTTAQKRASTANRAATRRKKAAKDTAPAAARARAQPQPDDNDGGNDDDLDIDLVDAPGETPQEKRERVAFENDERRKEELHQAQLAAAYPSKQGYDEAYFLLNNYTFPQTNMSQFIKCHGETMRESGCLCNINGRISTGRYFANLEPISNPNGSISYPAKFGDYVPLAETGLFCPPSPEPNNSNQQWLGFSYPPEQLLNEGSLGTPLLDPADAVFNMQLSMPQNGAIEAFESPALAEDSMSILGRFVEPGGCSASQLDRQLLKVQNTSPGALVSQFFEDSMASSGLSETNQCPTPQSDKQLSTSQNGSPEGFSIPAFEVSGSSSETSSGLSEADKCSTSPQVESPQLAEGSIAPDLLDTDHANNASNKPACKISNKDFPWAKAIKEHTMAKPFHCSLCRKKYASRSSLGKHTLNHHSSLTETKPRIPMTEIIREIIQENAIVGECTLEQIRTLARPKVEDRGLIRDDWNHNLSNALIQAGFSTLKRDGINVWVPPRLKWPGKSRQSQRKNRTRRVPWKKFFSEIVEEKAGQKKFTEAKIRQLMQSKVQGLGVGYDHWELNFLRKLKKYKARNPRRADSAYLTQSAGLFISRT